MQSSPKDFRSISLLVKSYSKLRSSILQYCNERSITPYLQGFDVRPRQYMRMLQIMPGERDTETWGQPFDSPEPEQSTPISTGTLIDVPEEIESHFYPLPSRIWSELMALPEAEEKLHWWEVLWDERTEVAANWRKWNVEDILLLDPPFAIRVKDYHPLFLVPRDYIELENWLLKNPLPKKRERDNSEETELDKLIQRAYLLQSERGNTQWRSVLKAMEECLLPGERFVSPRSLASTAKLTLYLEDSDSSKMLKLSTFQKNLSQYRTGKRKISLTE